MIARFIPRLKPCAARPQARARTSSSTCDQVQVCQMPRSFSRVAGWLPRIAAWWSRRRGNVSRAGVTGTRLLLDAVGPADLLRGSVRDASYGRILCSSLALHETFGRANAALARSIALTELRPHVKKQTFVCYTDH